jgi:Uma2 family endonuclease
MIAIEEDRATIEDLLAANYKAELINGKLVRMMATGRLPNRIAGRIYASLLVHSDQSGVGEAYTDNMGFAVQPLRSGRESFSPDVGYFIGTFPQNEMRFIEGAPTFAVEVRSESDYRSTSEIEIAAKRNDYFEAGTAVVWDVDTKSQCINCYRKSSHYVKIVFKMGDIANAEPAVPGWHIAVAQIFQL